MASIWMDRRGESPRKLAGRLSPLAALTLFDETVKSWNGPTRREGLHCLLWREGEPVDRPFGLLVLELMSPPSQAEPGEQRRVEAAKKGKSST